MAQLNKITKWLLILDVLVVVIAISVFLYRWRLDSIQVTQDLNSFYSNQNTNESKPNANTNTIAVANTNTDTTNDGPVASEASITMPFTTQAPFAVWDALHEDACEEASLLMVKHFLGGTQFESKGSADTEIKNMISYEEANGMSPSITLNQLNSVAANYSGMKNGVVKTDMTIDDIMLELSNGRPVIVGAAGKLLKNPNFKDGGPNYHMLVIKGFDANGFITNDPGTRLGENYRYDFATLYNAIHDFDAGNIVNGQKAYLVFK